MKPSSLWDPKVRLSLTLFAVACFAVMLLVQNPFRAFPAYLIASLIAAVLAAALTVLQARRDRLGDDEYLRRQLAGRQLMWRGQSRWVKALGLISLVLLIAVSAMTFLRDEPWVLWWGLGVFSGRLVGYAHWKAHWQRLQEIIAADEETAGALALGGNAR